MALCWSTASDLPQRSFLSQATSTAPLPNSQPSEQTNHYLVGEKTQTQLSMGKNLPLLMLLLQPG